MPRRNLVCAYKINLAFLRSDGGTWLVYGAPDAHADPREIVTIGDGKRGDIGNSSERYAKLFVEDYGFAASTVNPYMGGDSVALS